MNEILHEIVRKFFEWVGITITSITIDILDKDVNIRLETPDSPLIIGMHGANLDSFQHLLSRMIEKQEKKFNHVHLEVNDYMKSKDDRLFRFLETKIAFVTSTGKTSKIPNLNSYERKKAHSYVADKWIAGLKTHSDGEGAERVLVLEYSGEIRPLSNPSSAAMANQGARTDDLSEDGVGI